MRALLFVPLLLVALVACGGNPKPPAPVATASTETPPSSSSSSASSTPTAAAPQKKRTRSAAAKPPPQDGTKPKNGRALNPKDSTGRTVFVRADDHCFVEVPPKGSTEVVDCPDGANDPAFDHCTSQVVVEEGSSPEKCYCVNGAVVPRPMPNPTPCPKH